MKGSMVQLDPRDVLHIPGLGFDGLVGYSPIAMAKNAIGMAMAAEEYGAAFFNNGASPGAVLEHPGVMKDPERVRDAWNRAFRGSGNANKVAVLEEGMKYTPISISPEQAQFLETRKFQIDEIARIPAMKDSVGKALSRSNSGLVAEVDAKLEKLQKELLKKANAKQAFDSIADQIEDLREEKRQLLFEDATNEGIMQKVRELERFIDSKDGPVTEYDEVLVRRLIEKVTVYDDRFTVEFKSGLETDIPVA